MHTRVRTGALKTSEIIWTKTMQIQHWWMLGVCVCVCRPYSLVPSSDTIPRPSALFCLSKAFRSNTLLAAHSGSSLTTHLHASDITAASRPAKDKTRLTCRFASKPEHSGRIPHPFYPSNNPAFSAQRDSEEWQHC